MNNSIAGGVASKSSGRQARLQQAKTFAIPRLVSIVNGIILAGYKTKSIKLAPDKNMPQGADPIVLSG